MGIAIVDAVKLAKDNKRSYEHLDARRQSLAQKMAAESGAQQKSRTELYESALAPFQKVFGRLKNVDLVELARIDLMTGRNLPEAALPGIRIGVVQSLGVLAGGAAAGAGVGAATFAAVGAFATASTGAAISGLSGAAATSATLAWLGGGSIAAGGGGVAAGTTVLSGIVAAPVALALVAIVEWQGRKARNGERVTSAKLVEAAAALDRAEADSALVRRRSRQVRDVLGDLRVALSDRLPSLDALITSNPDYMTYTSEQRRVVAQPVAIASAAVMVMSTPIATDDGTVNEHIRPAVLAAKQRLLLMTEPS
ncbi:hypothetical protein [Pseudofrankia inefficax]|uniref:Uncharacterized protein n=1 Tax=Pseudofrankia inefficax (strain DSM 45817 / CECT 9037 / DDB 130130 / EuI1c) TaxID=298654 RepID=E3J6C0_PSEI1|nr:hypothetical protein [Pseudofrankia inefficax]ADP79547.1 hypothetical protein FraEuI1c_1485 [Pseudofrankia inefficax]